MILLCPGTSRKPRSRGNCLKGSKRARRKEKVMVERKEREREKGGREGGRKEKEA